MRASNVIKPQFIHVDIAISRNSKSKVKSTFALSYKKVSYCDAHRSCSLIERSSAFAMFFAAQTNALKIGIEHSKTRLSWCVLEI